MAKMYYTEAQACERLKVDSARLMDMVRRGQLHAYADGPNKMFKVAEVDTLAGSAAPAVGAPTSGDSDIQLAPVDSSGTHDTVSLTDSTSGLLSPQDTPKSGTKSGTSGGTKSGTKSGTRGLADTGIKLSDTGPVPKLDTGTGTTGLSGTDLKLSDSGAHTLSDSSTPPTKHDTVITSEGISIFDDEDLEIETADPMAKTQIAPSLDEQIGGEGASAGSGLLDLTRESDDTSLGAEVLGHIDMESGEAAAPSVDSVADSIPGEPEAAAPAIETVMVIDRPDPSAGPFTGMAVGAAVVLLLLCALATALISGIRPAFVQMLGLKVMYVLAAAVVLVGAGLAVGALMGKKPARPPKASGG
jgi:hypothetical protein